MFIVEKTNLKTDKKTAIPGATIKVTLDNGEFSSFKIMAINNNFITLSLSSNPADIYLLDTSENTLKNIVSNKTKKVASVSIVISNVATNLNLSTLAYEVKTRVKSEEELKVGDSFMYNNSIKCVVSYLSEDKSLMVVKYVNSGKEIAVEYKDAYWLKNANIKGRV